MLDFKCSFLLIALHCCFEKNSKIQKFNNFHLSTVDGNIFDTLHRAILGMEVESGEVELVINPSLNDAYLTDKKAGEDSVGIISGAALPADVLGTVEVIPVAAELDNDLSDCNWTRTHNHLFRKRTLNHLAKLAK